MKESSIALSLSTFGFLLTVIWGTPLLRVLRHFKVGKNIRVEGPERHFTKFGTPTMGGVLILLPVALITVLMNGGSLIGLTVSGRSVLLPLGVMLGYALLGAVDDWEGLRGRRKGKGLRARTKFIVQWSFALVVAIGLYRYLKVPELYLPGFKKEIEIGFWYIPIAMFVIVGSSNGMNLTDGLDGLAGLIAATAFATFGVIAIIQKQVFLARFCFTLVGALFGFLWFNVHPAQLFMGDTGSLPLGAVLGVVSLMTGHWILMPVIAVIPFAETISDILQV